MGDEELNKWLHENVMQGCVHQSDKHPSNPNCSKCFMNHFLWLATPDYCNSLDAAAKVEAKVVAKVGNFNYARALKEVLRTSGASHFLHLRSDECFACGFVATATAKQRAKACKEAWNNFEIDMENILGLNMLDEGETPISVAPLSEQEADEILRQNGIDPSGLVEELQDRMQRRVAFDQDLTDQERENLRWAIKDIERDREVRANVSRCPDDDLEDANECVVCDDLYTMTKPAEVSHWALRENAGAVKPDYETTRESLAVISNKLMAEEIGEHRECLSNDGRLLGPDEFCEDCAIDI